MMGGLFGIGGATSRRNEGARSAASALVSMLWLQIANVT